MNTLLKIASGLALGVWLGAMLFFAMGVAPVAFSVLPDRAVAGTLVNGSMARLHVLGYLCGAIGALALAARGARLAAAVAGVALVLTLASGLAITPPMAEIRARVGAIDALAADHPDRQRFDWLHQLSVGLMSVNMLVTAVAIGLDRRQP